MIKKCKNPDCKKEFWTKRSVVNYCSRDCSNKDRQRVVFETEREYQILSCGGGVQSAAMIALCVKGEIELPDMVVMVDTGYEKSATMAYVHKVLMPACESIGVPFKILHTPDNNIWSKQGMILMPAFKVLEDGSNQRLYTLCNGGWKLNVIKKYLRGMGVKRGISWIGISTDESKRQRKAHQQWLLNRYPLIEKGLSRYQCLFLIRSLGWPDPPRSSCIMCPLQSDEEWELMKMNNPDDYKRCVDMDNEIEARNKTIFLHRSMVRLRDIMWRCDVEAMEQARGGG